MTAKKLHLDIKNKGNEFAGTSPARRSIFYEPQRKRDLDEVIFERKSLRGGKCERKNLYQKVIHNLLLQYR